MSYYCIMYRHDRTIDDSVMLVRKLSHIARSVIIDANLLSDFLW